MSKKWEQMTKNQKLNALRAEVAMIVNAIDNLVRRLDHAERRNSKKRMTKVKRAPEKVLPPALDTVGPAPCDLRAQ
jgi:nitrate/nitrite-specific signal transduction histidine kinase